METSIRSPDSNKLKQVIRYDSAPVNSYFTKEGYFMDEPIVTTCGIFEYRNEDGSIRRELRLPEEVFKEESLASYEGKPIIVTHAAGEVNKDNVAQETIGTILSKGYQDGNNVRAKIVVHETDIVKRIGLRELSLGYKLTLDETPGIWHGQPYDAIQRDIIVNHLALVLDARAGHSARLNMDEKNKENGGTIMSIKAKRKDGDDVFLGNGNNDGENIIDQTNDPAPVVEQDPVQLAKDRRDRRDAAGEPETLEQALPVIAEMNEDINSLLDYIEVQNAEKDFATGDGDDVPQQQLDGDDTEGENVDGAGCVGVNKDGGANCNQFNADSIDRIVAQRLDVIRTGERLGIDVEKLSVANAKKAIIAKQKPNIRLDGKSPAYINAMYDLIKDSIRSKSNTDMQRQSMFRKDGETSNPDLVTNAAAARQRMISRAQKNNFEGGNK